MNARDKALADLPQVQEYGRRTGRFGRASIERVQGEFPSVPFARNCSFRNHLLVLEDFRFNPSDTPVKLMIPITDFYPFEPPQDVVIEGPKPDWVLLLYDYREIPSPLSGDPSTILLWHFRAWNPARDNLMTVVNGMRLLFQNWARH